MEQSQIFMHELNLVAPINRLSYGIVGYNLLKELSKSIRVNLFPIGGLDGEQSWKPIVEQGLKNQDDFLPYGDSLRVYHQFSLAEHVGSASSRKIGFPIFELDTFTSREKHHLIYCDKLLVCSSWAKEVIQHNLCYPTAYLNRNVHVVPLGVDTDIFKPEPIKEGTFRFLNIGKWEVRKGHDMLLSAFNTAFEPSDDVELWMMPTNPFVNCDHWVNQYKTSKMGNKIQILNRVDNQKEIAEVINHCHCGVFPSRAEGFNLPLLEVMACGRHVITTNYSAHTEFCDENNSYLIPIFNTVPAYDGIWFNKQGNWAELGQHQFDTLVEHMRYVVKNVRDNPNGVKTAQKFSWKNTAERILEI